MNVILLSKNYSKYTSGYYHQDIVDSFIKLENVFLYGLGYPNYDRNDRIQEVINKSPFQFGDIDYIVLSTSWDDDRSEENVNPHPNINLSSINIPKVYFLNKEYKKLELRFQYIKQQNVDLVCTVHPNAKIWEKELGVPFFQMPFGISMERFYLRDTTRKFDFGFSGGLHKSHTDLRFNVKKKLFKSSSIDQKSTHGASAFLRKNPLKGEFQRYNIFWAEWGAHNFMFQSLLPKGKEYVNLLASCKVFLNTPSAIGIINTRFYELMALKTLILCPDSDAYNGFMKDNVNCLMFRTDMSNFEEKFIQAIENTELRERITNKAHKEVFQHSYDQRILTLIDYISKNIL